MLSDDHSQLSNNTAPVVETMVKSFLKVLAQSGADDDIQKHSETIAKLLPYANPEYISQQVARHSAAYGTKKIESITSDRNIHNYVYSLLEENNANSKNFASDTTPTKAPSNSFKMNSLTATLDSMRKKDSYIDEVSSSNMVIHVCDEAKNLKQDFDCPRDLLIQEMRYFAEYLSVDAQRLEEVDISVHCDIHIFDWLMRYVKRGTKLIDESDVPRLDPNNVISILISSDFLKMGSLVEACITYCYKNMSLIVSTPCNMNCVNETLTGMIAYKFTHSELEDIKDRKDKFKSKLFCKKIEKLFDPNEKDLDSPGKAISLFKCMACQRVLTMELNSKLPCTNNRLSVGSVGDLVYDHEPDGSWDVNNYLISLYEELRKWNLVYWRLWGIINYLDCSRCGQAFQICDFGNCFYHPERPQYHQMSVGDTVENPVGQYPCCNQHVLRFDPTGLNKGCRSKDHSVSPSNQEQRHKLDDYMSHKSLIKCSIQVSTSSNDLNIFASEETRCSIKETTMTPVEISVISPIPFATATSSPNKTKLKKGNPSSDNGEEDVPGEEDIPAIKKSNSNILLSPPSHSQHSFLTVSASSSTAGNDTSRSHTMSKKKEKIQIPTDNTSYKRFPSKQRWDSGRSIRWNQDVQREEDRRRLTAMASNLTKQRTIEKHEKTKVKDPKDLAGGIFMKLEVAFFNNLKNQGNYQVQNLSRQYGGGKDFKSKLRR